MNDSEEFRACDVVLFIYPQTEAKHPTSPLKLP
ncbi:hypothetical protein L13192_10852 [Pyrenophora tritici-repentis]|uniref:Uncharacterized protein n=1 Tax=Pyrenophora tritici-repentis TaxID=45151 RepID=A0A922SZC7_9PLEO|nr:hypothetical protein Ptr86124_007898 [Pyrenophora tritici-repentis]KAI1664733.1 hypothetical protein L13192_10852 [Pyrenophora tritici-repentis]KAI1689835.1 hypothetical protein KJE20_03013 [Pyrenophora tritici-repentis]